MVIRTIHILYHSFLLLGEFIGYRFKWISPSHYGRRLACRIEKLGGIYLKIGQLLSVRPDIISFQVSNELHPLLQNLKPITFLHIKKKIETAESGLLQKNLTYIDPIPLGTGSIAQVHKVQLVNGTTAVLKILKPNIRKHLNADLRMFRMMMKAGSYMPGLKKLPGRELAKEIDNMIRQQLDLRSEVVNLQQFQKNFEGNQDIIIPGIHTEVNSPEFILMDYIKLPPDQIFENWSGKKRTETGKKALNILYQMMFKDGLTHCDMHPGNFFITPEGKFILLDFGMVARMDGEIRNDFVRFFFYMATNNGKGCSAIIEKTALHKAKGFSREKLDTEVEKFIAEFSSLSTDQFSVLAFTKRLIEVEKKCGIKGSTAFISNILAIAFFESHMKRVNPDIDFQEQAAQYILNQVPDLETVFDGII